MSEDIIMRQKLESVARENKMSSNRLLLMLLGFAILLSGILIGLFVRKDPISQTSNYIPNSSYTRGKYSLLDEVWQEIDNNYIEKDLATDELVYGTAKGLIDALDDKYSIFMTPKEVGESDNRNAGIFEGIGTTLRFDGDYTVIETPITGFPASLAGLMPRDIILEVDGNDMTGKTAYYVADNILGDAGTMVHIKIYRESDGQQYDFDIKRAKIDIDNIEYENLGDGIYVISINKFTESTMTEFKKTWNGIVSEVDSPQGIVLDLRNNPGGYVGAATYVLEEFLGKNTKLMTEVDRNGKKDSTYVVRNGEYIDVPLVVLVNGGSASASEIVAGAIQDHNRAKLIGEETLGKGVEQKVINISDGSKIHLVFKKWLTPNGNNINFDNAIVPDIVVEYTMEDFKNSVDPQMEVALEQFRAD